MHWGCWALGDEPFMQDPQRLKQACVDGSVDPGEFNTLYIGETLRQTAGVTGVPSELKIENA
jgi:N-acyl-phosphatidylethanolamine-hydrolysing phospholipase D